MGTPTCPHIGFAAHFGGVADVALDLRPTD
jgi:hypothetical protein